MQSAFLIVRAILALSVIKPSTSASSAVLSGLVLKAYIILFIKIVYRVFGIEVIRASKVLDISFVLGVLAMTIGSIKAINSRDLKRMIAFVPILLAHAWVSAVFLFYNL